MCKSVILLGFIVFISTANRISSQQPGCREAANNETEALISFRNNLKISFWNATDVHSWEGLGWNPNGELENISLVKKGLTGTLYNVWDELPSLLLLDLSQNNFSGVQVAVCNGNRNTKLKALNLSSNFIHEFPDNLSASLVRLEVLDLSNNWLKGEVPQFATLRFLNLSTNNLTGDVSIGNNVHLDVLDLSHNKLNGLFTELLQLQAVRVVNLSNNEFGGDIPGNVFGQLGNLTRLVLSDNHFVGGIPAELGNCPRLSHLELTTNNLTGGIPASLGRLSVLSAGYNQLSGHLQFEPGSFQSLETLYLHSNGFNGALPNALGSLPSLKKVYLSKNKFIGPLPPELGNLSRIQELWLSENRFSGVIPMELSKLAGLQQLVLNGNNISGSIPPELSKCSQLLVLWLEGNQFTGTLPESFGDLKKLLMLGVSNNSLSGTIPDSYGNLQSLLGLDVGTNKLTGRVPHALSKLKSLQFLFLSNNNFSGEIPEWLPSMTSLRALDFSYNKLSGKIPASISRLFDNVMLYKKSTESALVHTGGLIYVGFALPTTIDLSHNQLTGEIPTEIGKMSRLQVLDLSDNHFTGGIPSSLGNAKELMKLNLSSNNLTGEIPYSLVRLSFLIMLDVSHNHLVGEIPRSGQFLTFSNSSFVGNNLCGPPLSNCSSSPSVPPSVPVLPTEESSPVPVGRRLFPGIISVCGAIFLCGILALYFAHARKRQKLYTNGDGYDVPMESISMAFSDKLPDGMSLKMLVAATNNYSSMNIVGDGGFGVVYRAVLESGAVLAVKKLTSGGLQGDREFLAEVQTLGDLRHKNLVPLLGFFSDGNDRLLIYKYLKNGSLDTWLYCREPGMNPLNWLTRLKIARGAAKGIAYLHEGGDHAAIIHRDIKVSNILLDEDFEAHVADFGLARLVNAGETHVSTDVAGTIGYIPPEYNHKCFATAKGDVYSFGVVCLEILTAKRPTDQLFRKNGAGHLVAWIRGMRTVEELKGALDTSMEIEANVEQMLDMMRLACWCCRDAPSKRPSIQEVASMLEKLERLALAVSKVEVVTSTSI